jgi:alcohol dehydrogenase YqhD (iron-dependent ADH family)
MRNVEYHSSTKVRVGTDTVDQVGACVRGFGGTHTLIVYGRKRTVKSGLRMRVLLSPPKAV